VHCGRSGQEVSLSVITLLWGRVGSQVELSFENDHPRVVGDSRGSEPLPHRMINLISTHLTW